MDTRRLHKMINIPKIPPKADLEFKEKAFLVEAAGQFRQTSRIWFYALLAVAVLAIPGGIILKKHLAARFIAGLPALEVAQNAPRAAALAIAAVNFLPVGESGIFSAYAHVFNPNAELAARSFQYQFQFKGPSGAVLHTVSGRDFLARGASKFIVVPRITFAEPPQSATLVISDTQWTRSSGEALPQFDILQKQWGGSDGKFFVEAVVKNPNSFTVKRAFVPVVVFDGAGKNVLAVNQTVLDDIQPFESRYFRVFWPIPESGLFPSGFGQIEARAEINPFDAAFR